MAECQNFTLKCKIGPFWGLQCSLLKIKRYQIYDLIYIFERVIFLPHPYQRWPQPTDFIFPE